MYTCVKPSPRDLNHNPYLSYLTNTYTPRATIAPRMHGDAKTC